MEHYRPPAGLTLLRARQVNYFEISQKENVEKKESQIKSKKYSKDLCFRTQNLKREEK